MAKATLSDISKLFKSDDKQSDFHYYGRVVSVNSEDRTYEVSINRDENITVEAARLVGAHVGDTVMVTVMANGYATVTGRVGGDTDATDAQAAADAAASVADSARTTATNALNSATQASGIAAKAKTKAENAIALAEAAEAEAGRARDAADESERQADLSRQAAQASAQQADLSRQAADLSAQNALGSKISADAAQDAAEAAQDAAEDAQSASESARDRAISAEGYAQQANTHATQAETYAGQALSSAETANTAANSAITQLGVVQDVVGVLDWVSTHATYKTSRDTSVVAGKMYFTKSGNTYTLVVNPTGNPSTQGYYEIDSIDEAVTNYVTSHLALTNDGLWVTKDNNGYKILVSNTGVKIYDPQGILVSTFGESISFSSTRPQKIGNDNQYIEYYNDNGTYKVRIVADNITLGGSNVATTLSNLAAADTAQTNALNAYKTSNDAAVAANATGLANYIASNNSVIESLERQIDGAIDTWYYSGVPTLNNDPAKNWPANTYESHERDLYFDTSTGHTYRFARTGNTEPYTYEWVEIQDADALRALQAAAAAQDTADNKRRVFTVSSNDHPVPPYDVGDLWVQGQNGDILRCVQTRLDPQVWSASDWQPASKYTDDSAVTALAGNVYTKSEVYTKQNIDTKIGEINTTITNKETTIKAYADTQASTAETAAKTYADDNFDSKGSAASALDDAKDYADDNFDSKGSASAAQAAAISAAAADATSKANNAKDAAISSAATDATTKANNAKNAAISAAATDATNKANAAKQAAIDDAASKYYNKTETYTKSEVDQKAGEISLSVAQEEVNKIEVGGRNLLLYSKEIDLTKSTYSSSTLNGTDGSNLDGITPYNYDTKTGWKRRHLVISFPSLVIGNEYTLSFEYARTYAAIVFLIEIGNNAKQFPTYVDSKWRKVDFTFTATANDTSAVVYSNDIVDKTLWTRHFKLEKGNKATDWTPAPEDLENYTDTKITEAKAEIKVTTDAIESTVSNKVGNNEVISKIRQSAETVKIKANQVEIDGTATFNAIKTQADAAYDSKGSASTAESNAKTYADGKASTAESNAKSYADGKASTAEQNAKAYVDANYVANTAALSRTQRIYYRSDSSTLPNPPTENNKGKWFEPTQTDTGYNTWSRDIVPLIGGFPYLFMCDQTQTAAQYVAGNECTNSSVMRDDSTSVIDGGSITTGKINANYIEAAGLQIGRGQVDGLGEFMSLMTFKDGVLRIAKPGSRFAVELSDEGLFFKQNDTAVSYINMNRLYIPYAVVLDQMMVGKEENNSLWAWTSEEDGNLTLRWIGGNN